MLETIWAIIVIGFFITLFFTISYTPFMLVMRAVSRKRIKSRFVPLASLFLVLPVAFFMLIHVASWTAHSFEVLGSLHPFFKGVGMFGIMILAILSLTLAYLVSGCLCRQVGRARYFAHCFRYGVRAGDPPLW